MRKMKKFIRGILIVFIVLFAISLLLFIILTEYDVGRARGILSNIAQGLLTGTVTFLGLFITLSEQNKVRSEDKEEHERLRMEERKKETCPCFYIIFENIYGRGNTNDAIDLSGKAINKRAISCSIINARNNVPLNVGLVSPTNSVKSRPNLKRIDSKFVLEISKLLLSTQNDGECFFSIDFDDIYGLHYRQKICYEFKNEIFTFKIDQPEEDNEKNQ